MTEFPIVDAGPNITRQVLADHPELMVVKVDFTKAGAFGTLHSHLHVQSILVQSGRFKFSVDGQAKEVGQGDCFVVPSNTEHGCICLEAGTLIDVFTPRRDDFL
ncbi:cupin domain-containing protein [Yoonia sp. MH D7]